MVGQNLESTTNDDRRKRRRRYFSQLDLTYFSGRETTFFQPIKNRMNSNQTKKLTSSISVVCISHSSELIRLNYPSLKAINDRPISLIASQ